MPVINILVLYKTILTLSKKHNFFKKNQQNLHVGKYLFSVLFHDILPRLSM
jgi:hypothetical protein